MLFTNRPGPFLSHSSFLNVFLSLTKSSKLEIQKNWNKTSPAKIVLFSFTFLPTLRLTHFLQASNFVMTSQIQLKSSNFGYALFCSLMPLLVLINYGKTFLSSYVPSFQSISFGFQHHQILLLISTKRRKNIRKMKILKCN